MDSLRTKENFIISLIVDDIINSKLINSLNKAGLDAGDYFLNLSKTIFRLMALDDTHENEEIFELYLVQLKRAENFDIKSRERFENLAKEIYHTLDKVSSGQIKIKGKKNHLTLKRNLKRA